MIDCRLVDMNCEKEMPVASRHLIMANHRLDDMDCMLYDYYRGTQTFLERFYLVLDTTNKRVGLANTTFTHATTN